MEIPINDTEKGMPKAIEWLTEEDDVLAQAKASARPLLIDFFKPG